MSDNEHTTKTSKGAREAVPSRRKRRLGAERGFGRRLKEAREPLKQADIAKRAKVARSALARYESGERFPSVPELRRLCDVLKVSPTYLVFGDDQSTAFKTTESEVKAAAPDDESEIGVVSRNLYTALLLNILPRNESSAFLELIWSSANKQIGGDTRLLSELADLCDVIARSMDLEEIADDLFERNPDIRQSIEKLGQ